MSPACRKLAIKFEIQKLHKFRSFTRIVQLLVVLMIPAFAREIDERNANVESGH